MNPALQSFLSVALPIMVTLIAASWVNNSRLTDMRVDLNRRFDEGNRRIDEVVGRFDRRIDEVIGRFDRRFDEVVSRLDRIERKLDNHDERIVRLEERTSPLHR